MISNYNLSCDYHNFELKDKIYLIPDYALKVIYTDGFNEVVFSGNTTNMTILEGHDISFQEESSFDERFKFSKSVSIKVNGYKTFNDLDYRYCVVLETKEGEFYLVNVDFPSFVTHTYTLNNGTNSTELVFSSQSNIATLKLTNFNPNNVNSCKQYSNAKIKNVKLTESWASSLSTWQKTLVNKGEFVDIEPLPDSISLTEEFDGEKYTVTLGFDIPMSHFKNDWHLKLLQFEENKYRGYISLEDGNKAFVGYNVGLFPSYTINGDIISIRLTETAIRGIAYGDDYAIIDTDMPNSIEFSGATCNTYNFESSCDWEVEDKPDYITIAPTSGQAETQYELTICNTDDETGYAVSEFVIRSCNAVVRPEVVIKNTIYRWVNTEETMCTLEPISRTVSGDPYCNNCNKYIDVFNEISYDNGESWFISSSSSTLVEENSADCGYRTRTVADNLSCDGDNLVGELVFEVSCDSGETWHFSSSSAVSVTDSEYCNGYGFFTIKSLKDGNTITFTKERNSQTKHYKLYYSLDKSLSWNEYTGPITDIWNGQEVIFKNNSHDYIDWTRLGTFNCTKNYAAKGNLLSIINASSSDINFPDYYSGAGQVWGNAETFTGLFSGSTTLVDASELWLYNPSNVRGAFAYMFYGCTNLTSAKLPNLAEAGMGPYTFKGMFKNCTSLTTPPVLPSGINEQCFREMFAGCTSLTSTPVLSATSLANSCYTEMFADCTSLTELPNLPATSLTNYCYAGMFKGCTGITSVPSDYLPATALTEYCYSYMFENCTSLSTLPTLPATSYVGYDDVGEWSTHLAAHCYEGMFKGCSSLSNIPSRYLTSKSFMHCGSCYAYMFQGCTSLTTIPEDLLPAYNFWGSDYKGMFADCTSLVTVPNNVFSATSNLNADYTHAGMFSGCTSLVNVPSRLPGGVTSSYNCRGSYQYMFAGCTSLVTAPSLNSTNYRSPCSYTGMFSGCTSLTSVTCLATAAHSSADDISISNWLKGVPQNGTFYKNSRTARYYWVTGEDGIPSGWTVVDINLG